jgi:SRSO17 transposase
MQAVLAEHAWDWAAAIVVLDETAELKKGDRTVGVARQHAGITGQVENCQTAVFAAYVTARAHTLVKVSVPEAAASSGWPPRR